PFSSTVSFFSGEYSVPSVPTTVTVAFWSGENPVPEKPIPSFLFAMSVRVTCDCSRVACGSDSSGTEESDSESSESLDDCSPLWAQTDVGDTEAVDSVAANAGALARPVIATATAGASTRREVFTVMPFDCCLPTKGDGTPGIPWLKKGKAPSCAGPYSSFLERIHQSLWGDTRGKTSMDCRNRYQFVILVGRVACLIASSAAASLIA